MSIIRLCSVFIVLCMDFLIKETAAFTSWQQPLIPSANGSGEASIVLPENHPVNTSTGIKLKVLGGTGDVSYFMLKTPYFSLDPGSGEISLRIALDYETSSSMEVVIGAVDRGVNNCTATMTIRIGDVNDNAPVFSHSVYNMTTRDSSLIGASVGFVSATDADGHSNITYKLAGGYNYEDFRINSDGLISVAKRLMAFRQPQYMMTVLAVDGAENAFTATATVKIVVNEDTGAKRCEPLKITVNVSDDLKIGETVPIHVMCSNWVRFDPYFVLIDPLGVHYNISANNKMPYLVKKSTQQEPKLEEYLRVYDGPLKQSLINGIPLKINAVAMNDAPTISPDFLVVDFPENTAVGTEVGTLVVHDPDEGDWGIISIDSNDKPDFINISSVVGDEVKLVITSTLDVDIYYQRDERGRQPRLEYEYEEYEYHDHGGYGNDFDHVVSFQVLVADSLGLNATAMVALNITDINDNAPICSPHDIVKRVPRDIGIETAVVNLGDICYDADLTSDNNFLTYRMKKDSCQAYTGSSPGLSSAFDIFMGTGYLSVAGEMPLTQKSCQIVVSVEDNGTPQLNTLVKVEIQFLECPNDTDYLGIHWSRGIPGQYMLGTCPNGARSSREIGRVRRFCDENGNYHDPVYNCTRSEITDIYNKLFYDKSKTITASSVLDDLVDVTSAGNGTNDILMIGDIEALNKMLSKITAIVKADSTDIQNITNLFIEVTNNMMRKTMTTSWRVMINETGSGADSLIDNLDRFVQKIATAPDSKLTTAVFAKTNLLLKIGMNVMCDTGINFPNRTHDVVPAWAANTVDNVNMPCSESSVTHIHDDSVDDSMSAEESKPPERKSYSSAMYRNVSKIVSLRSTENKSLSAINAPMMSFTYYPSIVGNLVNPVEITFQIYETTMENPNCLFWTRNSSAKGYWSDEGCWLHKYDKENNVVICKCDHLTNFALLMTPSVASSRESSHHLTLSIISMTGCIISMICLFVTVVIHVILWKTVKSVRSIINMNLASSLFVAYLLFLTGVNQTENKGLCTAIAVLLHFVYLLVFFIMLVEGLNLAHTVLKPLSTRKPGIPLLVAAYVLAVVTVGISMAAVKLEGYGSDAFCWLSTHTGLIWAFIAPVLFVIVVNGIIICIVIRKMCGTVAMSRKTNKEKARAGIRSVFVLLPIMGVTWVFGIFSVNEDTVIFQYLFAVFNSLQGLLIFIFHCVMNRKIKEGIGKKCGRSRFQTTSGSTSAESQLNKKSQVTQKTTL